MLEQRTSIAGPTGKDPSAMPLLTLLLVLGLTAAAADLVVETARADGTRLVMAGTDVLTGLSLAQTMQAVAAVTLVTGLVIAWWLVATIRRRRERKLSAMSEDVRLREAELESRRQLVTTHIDELERANAELLAKRDGLMSEIDRLERRGEELLAQVRDRQAELSRPAPDAVVVADADDNGRDADLVVVPDEAPTTT